IYVEVRPVLHRPDPTPVGERVAHGELEPVGCRLEPSAVEWAFASRQLDTAALGAADGRVGHTVAVEEQLDTPIRGRFERVVPACGRTSPAAGLLTPALHMLGLATRSPMLE